MNKQKRNWFTLETMFASMMLLVCVLLGALAFHIVATTINEIRNGGPKSTHAIEINPKKK